MKSCVTISLVPEARGGPFVFWGDLANSCRQAAELGFDAVEIFPPSPDAVRLDAVAESLKAGGLPVAALGTGAGWLRHKLSLTSSDSSVRTAAVEFIQAMVVSASELNAKVILGSMQGKWEGTISREQALTWLGDGIQRIAEFAAQRQVTFLYEFLNRYETNLVNRISDAREFVAGLGCPNVLLLADLFHMNIEEASLPEAILDGGAAIGHVHFVDSNRRAPGMGHTAFAPVIAALGKIGYAGHLSAEALPLPNSLEAARATIRTFRALMAPAGEPLPRARV